MFSIHSGCSLRYFNHGSLLGPLQQRQRRRSWWLKRQEKLAGYPPESPSPPIPPSPCPPIRVLLGLSNRNQLEDLASDIQSWFQHKISPGEGTAIRNRKNASSGANSISSHQPAKQHHVSAISIIQLLLLTSWLLVRVGCTLVIDYTGPVAAFPPNIQVHL